MLFIYILYTHSYRSLLSTAVRYRSTGVKIGTRLLATIQTLWHQARRVGQPGLCLGEEGALVGKDSSMVEVGRGYGGWYERHLC